MAMKIPAGREAMAMAKETHGYGLEVEVVFTLVLFGFSAFPPSSFIFPSGQSSGSVWCALQIFGWAFSLWSLVKKF